MKLRFLVGAGVLIACAAPAYALNGSLEGGTGLINMRTADTLKQGDVDLSAFFWNNRYSDPAGGATKSDLLFMPSVNYGLWKDLEIGVSAPFVDNLDASVSGLRFFRGYAKYEFLDMPDEGIGAAVTAFGSASTTDKPVLSSGAHNYGVELNLSLPRLLAPIAKVYITAGLEKTDTRGFGAAPQWYREVKRKVDLGLDVPVRAGLDASLELLYTRSVSTDDNLIVAPGLRYQPARDLTLIAGLGVGVPKDKSQPRWRLLLGVSYIPGHGAPRSSAPPPAPPPPAAAPLPAQPSGAAAVPPPAPAPVLSGSKASATHGAARVEVLDASGVSGLADRVARALIKLGYNVVHVGDAGWEGQVQTQIFYSGAFGEEASKVARDLPGNQMIFEHQEADGNTDVQVIVGQDLNTAYH